jgi:hypothetical protein
MLCLVVKDYSLPGCRGRVKYGSSHYPSVVLPAGLLNTEHITAKKKEEVCWEGSPISLTEEDRGKSLVGSLESGGLYQYFGIVRVRR